MNIAENFERTAQLFPDNIRRFLKERLMGFKVPKAFVFVDDLPKNNAGKMLKRKIKEKYTY